MKFIHFHLSFQQLCQHTIITQLAKTARQLYHLTELEQEDACYILTHYSARCIFFTHFISFLLDFNHKNMKKNQR